MDIQNCSTPPKRVRFETPPRSNQPENFDSPQKVFNTPKRQAFETPKRDDPHARRQQDSSSSQLAKKGNWSFSASGVKRKENPESRMRQRQAQVEEEREQYQVSMFQLSRLEQDYQEVQILGRGNFSEVGLYRSRLSQELFAIKQTRANRMSINEVQALGSLWALVEQSPHVVRYFHSWVQEGQLFLVMEYCEDSLSKTIARHRLACKPFQERQIKKILREALQGLACLHKCGILHLDLKPDNMLLHADSLKIADFGLSRAARVRSGDIQQGDSRYLAREVLNYSPQVDLAKADIFSLAMTLFEMLTLQTLPNNGPEWMSVRDHGLQLCDRMDLTGYSRELLQLVQRMGSRDWFSRPSAFECLHAGYLKESARVSHLLAANSRSSKKRDNSL